MAEMEFREKLLTLRRENHMTQSGLANELCVTRQTVYKWETGQSYPEAMTLFAMRNLFGVPTDILLDKSVTLEEYRQSLGTSRVAALNVMPAAEVPARAEETARRENTTLIASASENKPAEDENDAETEHEKKKKGLFSRLFSR